MNDPEGIPPRRTSCTRGLRGHEEALLFLSAQDRKAYLAWKPENQKIVARPPVSEWLDKLRLELKMWADTLNLVDRMHIC